MKLDDLHPYVVPHVPDLPTPSIEHAMRVAANDFFRRTHAWQESVDPIDTVEGATSYEIAGPTGSEIVKVLVAEADGLDYAKAVKYRGDLTLEFQEDDAPKGGLVLNVTVALSPKVGAVAGSWTLPTSLDQYAQDIANGALSRLLAPMQGRREDAAMYGALFSNRINVVGLKVSREFARRRIGRPAVAQFY